VALTRRQRQVLDFITEFIDQNGYSPSLEEVGAHLGLSSVATVHKHVTRLVEKGLVRRSWNQNRSIEPVPQGSRVRAVELPLVGRVAAGRPIEALEDSETVSVPEAMVTRREKVFVLEVQGDSMIDEQIRNGDRVVVEERRTAENGEVVVALVDGTEATLKKFYRDRSRVRLQPANTAMKPIVLDGRRVQVQGVVVGLIRQYQ
jgi:repressor LexA